MERDEGAQAIGGPMRPMSLEDVRERWHADRAERQARQRLAQRVYAPPPPGVTDPELLAELTALGAEIVAAMPRGKEQSEEMRRKMRVRG